MSGGVRGPPLFQHSLWNVYHHIMNDLPRTTNGVEGWHGGFKRSVGHANVFVVRKCNNAYLRITQGVTSDDLQS